MSAASPDKIVASCPNCQAQMRVPASSVGKRVRCPKCSMAFTLEAPAEGEDGPPSLDAFATAEASAQAESSAAGSVHKCQVCGASILGEAKVCARCSTVAPPSVAGRAAGKATSEESRAGGFGALAGVVKEGNLLFGIIGSCIGAIVGGAIWFVVAKTTHYEIGWIAWGIGALAGWGMVLGYKETSFTAGVLAAAISAAGIVGAKFALFYMIFAGLWTMVPWDETAPPRDQLVECLADQKAGYEEYESEEVEEAAYLAAEEEIRPEVEKLSDAEVDATLAQARIDFHEKMKGNTNQLFFSFSFGVMDILFFGLALVAAFKIGTGMSAESE